VGLKNFAWLDRRLREPRTQLRNWRFESETPRLFQLESPGKAVHTKNVVEHSVLYPDAGREPLKNMIERAVLRLN
jgi:hypothetical protein